jgi:hypothetical protein
MVDPFTNSNFIVDVINVSLYGFSFVNDVTDYLILLISLTFESSSLIKLNHPQDILEFLCIIQNREIRIMLFDYLYSSFLLAKEVLFFL